MIAAMRPRPRFNPWAARCFESVFLPMRKVLLGDLVFLNLPASLPRDRPILLVGNHISNWDGFLFREIQRRLFPARPIFSIMLEEELRKRPLFRFLGGIGIDPGNPVSVAGAIRDVRDLRKGDPDFFLSFFPQGRIVPGFRRPLDFLPGIDLFLRAMVPATVIPVGLHMEPMHKLAPAMFISLGRPLQVDRPSPVRSLLADQVTAELDRIHAHLTRPRSPFPGAGEGHAERIRVS
ncbi:MAG: phospholipid/glycerol acyltransferase [Fibrobacteres bacterium]|nr:phospholipid/glycerol acyltransferase [Fibrobacterota bacterium]